MQWRSPSVILNLSIVIQQVVYVLILKFSNKCISLPPGSLPFPCRQQSRVHRTRAHRDHRAAVRARARRQRIVSGHDQDRRVSLQGLEGHVRGVDPPGGPRYHAPLLQDTRHEDTEELFGGAGEFGVVRGERESEEDGGA